MGGATHQALLMVGGHICTYDPATVNVTLSNGNLTATLTSVALGEARVLEPRSTGKYYLEFTIVNTSSSAVIGLHLSSANYVSGSTANMSAAYGSGNIDTNGGFSGNSVGSMSNGDVIGVAVDLTARLVWIRRNTGNWNGIGGANPATGVSGLTVGTGSFVPFAGFAATASAGNASTLNLGVTLYINGPPAGFSNWC